MLKFVTIHGWSALKADKPVDDELAILSECWNWTHGMKGKIDRWSCTKDLLAGASEPCKYHLLKKTVIG